jgi:hypothetical protein
VARPDPTTQKERGERGWGGGLRRQTYHKRKAESEGEVADWVRRSTPKRRQRLRVWRTGLYRPTREGKSAEIAQRRGIR